MKFKQKNKFYQKNKSIESFRTYCDRDVNNEETGRLRGYHFRRSKHPHPYHGGAQTDVDDEMNHPFPATEKEE